MRRLILFAPYVQGKEVLDVGCVDHDLGTSLRPDWLHAQLCRVARRVVGLDVLAEEVRELGLRGFRVVQGNAETFSLGERFDVIVAGELLEHVSNVGAFLDGARRHLRPGGRLLVTTPNAFALGNVLRIVRAAVGFPIRDNPEHTHWYDDQTLRQLLARHGFIIERLQAFSPDRYPGWLERIIPPPVRSKLFAVGRLAETPRETAPAESAVAVSVTTSGPSSHVSLNR